MDGLGAQRSAAMAQPTGEFSCGSDTWAGAAAGASGAVFAKWSMMAGTKDVMSWGPRLVSRFPSLTRRGRARWRQSSPDRRGCRAMR